MASFIALQILRSEARLFFQPLHVVGWIGRDIRHVHVRPLLLAFMHDRIDLLHGDIFVA